MLMVSAKVVMTTLQRQLNTQDSRLIRPTNLLQPSIHFVFRSSWPLLFSYCHLCPFFCLDSISCVPNKNFDSVDRKSASEVKAIQHLHSIKYWCRITTPCTEHMHTALEFILFFAQANWRDLHHLLEALSLHCSVARKANFPSIKIIRHDAKIWELSIQMGPRQRKWNK